MQEWNGFPSREPILHAADCEKLAENPEGDFRHAEQTRFGGPVFLRAEEGSAALYTAGYKDWINGKESEHSAQNIKSWGVYPLVILDKIVKI